MTAPVKYDRPPVVEVVCCAVFASPGPIQTAHIGAFWDRVKSDFPVIQDAAPFATILEQTENSVAEFEWTSLPPIRRALLANEHGSNLIQIQQDRFLFNWRQTLNQDQYPGYDKIIVEFEKYLGEFLSFLDDAKVSRPTFRQFELTYVNHITAANGLNKENPGNILVDHIRDQSRNRFLGQPEGFNWRSSYVFTESSGRLHVVAQSAASEPDKEKIVRLDLIARGFPDDSSAEARGRWFKMAHDWITYGFADVTVAQLQNDTWKRTS